MRELHCGKRLKEEEKLDWHSRDRKLVIAEVERRAFHQRKFFFFFFQVVFKQRSLKKGVKVLTCGVKVCSYMGHGLGLIQFFYNYPF